MAALNWQQDRLLGIDTVTLGIQTEVMAPALEAELEHLSTPARIALAYRDLSDHSRVLSNLDRHASRIRRQFNQLRTELLALQKNRTATETEPQPSTKFQNEPTAEQTHAPEQHTSHDTEPRPSGSVPGDSFSDPSATGPASRPPAAVHPSSESDSPLQSPDSSRKLQNEPTGRQTPIDQPIASSEAA